MKEHTAAIRCFHGPKDMEKRTLPAAAGAGNRDSLSRGHPQRDAVESEVCSVGLSYFVANNDGRSRGGSDRPPRAFLAFS